MLFPQLCFNELGCFNEFFNELRLYEFAYCLKRIKAHLVQNSNSVVIVVVLLL